MGNKDNKIEINLKCIISDVLDNLWIAIIVAGFVAMGVYLFSEASYSETYKTNATYAVTAKGSSASIYSNLATAKSIAEVMQDILSSDALKNKVAEELGMKKVPGNIEVNIVPESTLINVTVTASSPQMAFKIIKSAMSRYKEISDYVVSNAVLDEVSAPYVPMVPNSHFTGKEKMVKTFEYLFAAMLALFAALSVMSDRIKNQKDAEKRLDASVYAVVPAEKKKRMKKGQKKSILITNPETSFYFVEQLKTLATKVEHSLRKMHGKVIIITSVLENEGKSTLVANMAIALAQRGKKVLLVDADLRKPAVYKVFDREKAPNDGGLADYISAKKDKADLITYEEDLNFYMVSGRKSFECSTELLSSEKYKEFINNVREEYDYVLIDAVPIAYTADAEVIAEDADAVLLVVRQNTATAAMINDAIDDLNRCSAKLLGCVLNRSNNVNILDRSYNYGYGKYGYGNYDVRSEKNND